MNICALFASKIISTKRYFAFSLSLSPCAAIFGHAKLVNQSYVNAIRSNVFISERRQEAASGARKLISASSIHNEQLRGAARYPVPVGLESAHSEQDAASEQLEARLD